MLRLPILLRRRLLKVRPKRKPPLVIAAVTECGIKKQTRDPDEIRKCSMPPVSVCAYRAGQSDTTISGVSQLRSLPKQQERKAVGTAFLSVIDLGQSAFLCKAVPGCITGKPDSPGKPDR